MHRDLACAVALCFFAVAMTADAAACSRVGGPPSLRESVEAADEIFIAHVVSASEIEFPAVGPEVDHDDRFDRMGVEGRYVLVESLKGSTEENGVVHDAPAAPGNCSLGLMPGWDYIFFVQHQPDQPDFRWVGMFTGSLPLGPYRMSVDSEERELVEIRELLEQQREHYE